MNQDRLLGLYTNLRNSFFVVTGAVIISSAITFLLAHGCLDCTMVYWIPGKNLLAAWVYPPSVIIIGVFVILYGLRFGMRGFGLVLMVCGAFDVFAKLAVVYIDGLMNGGFGVPNDPYFQWENELMLAGFLLGGLPRLKLDKWLLGTATILVFAIIITWPPFAQFHGLFSYQLYELALFIYVYHSTELRPLPSSSFR